jgi:hypothetical protein
MGPPEPGKPHRVNARTTVHLRLAGVILAAGVATAACGSSAVTPPAPTPAVVAVAGSPSAVSATEQASEATLTTPSPAPSSLEGVELPFA